MAVAAIADTEIVTGADDDKVNTEQTINTGRDEFPEEFKGYKNQPSRLL